MAEQQSPLRRMVALKVIKPGMDTAKVLARFEAERQALALMDHPNIAKVFDAGATASGRPFFVMELVRGMPITAFCDKNHMPTEGRLKLFINVCHAIQHAHHKGVIHRDIKPSNVMVTLHDGVPVVKVIDFGVAKATVQKLTERTLFTEYGQMIGTPAYMSPEQAEMSGLDIDTRSDVYSLGVLLYELLTGTTPLDIKQLRAAGYAEVQRMIREEEAPRPSNRLSSLGDSATVLAGNRGLDAKSLARLLAGDLDWVVVKTLDKDRSRRYDTPGNLAEDIERYLSREPILARPPSAGYKIRRFVQRNRAAALTGGAIALSLLIGIVGTTIGLFRAEERRREAVLSQIEESKQRKLVTEEQGKTKAALQKSQLSELKAIQAEREALRQAANSGCDVAQQLCERNSVAQGLIEYGRALKFAHDANDADLEDAIRWNIGAWVNELHPQVYSIPILNRSRNMGAFNPAGTILAVSNPTPKYDGVIMRLYDAANGSPRTETITISGSSRVWRLAWQRSGESLAIYTGDGRIHVWRPGEASLSLSFPVDEGGTFHDGAQCPHLVFSPDGTKLLAGTWQPVARIFDASTGKPTGIEFVYHDRPAWNRTTPAVDWSRDGSRVITGNHNGIARISDAATGKLIREIDTATSGLMTLRFSPDGNLFVSTSGYGNPKLQVWNAQTGEPIGLPIRSREAVYDADFSPDGKLLLAGDASCEAFVWDVDRRLPYGAPIWTGGLATVASFHPSGRMMLTNSIGRISVWKLGAGMKRENVARIDTEATRVADFLERSKQAGRSIQIDQDLVNDTYLVLSPDGTRLIKHVPYRPGHLAELLDAKTLQTLLAIPGSSASTPIVYWTPDSRRFITANWGSVKIRDGSTGVAEAELGPSEPGSGAFRPDGARFAIADRAYHLRIFDTTHWKPVGPRLPHTSRVKYSAYTNDGKLLISSDSSLTTRLWHPSTGKRIGPVLAGIEPIVNPDNQTFSTWVGERSQGYQIPTPMADEVDAVIRGIESLTGQYGVVAPVQDSEAAPVGPMAPAAAIASVGQNVILEMVVRSVGLNTTREWMYLNSELDYKNPKNMTVAIKFPTVERRTAMGLNRENEKIVGLRVRVTGKVALYRDAPQIVVEETGQIEILPAKDGD